MENNEDNILEKAIESVMNEDVISEMPREEIKFTSLSEAQNNDADKDVISFTSISESMENEMNRKNIDIVDSVDAPLINEDIEYPAYEGPTSDYDISLSNEIVNANVLNSNDDNFSDTIINDDIDNNVMPSEMPMTVNEFNLSDNTYNGVQDIVYEEPKVSNDNEQIYVANENEQKRKKYFGYNERLLVYVLSVIALIVVAVVLFKNSISLNTKSNVTYKQTSNLDYKVGLKPNDYYKEQQLDKGMQYIASLIDYINIDFNYNFKASDKLNYKYIYYINADVKVTDSNDENKVIYSKSEKITEEKIVEKENSDSFSIKENLRVNYATYNDLVKGFKSSYAINADSNLELSLMIDIEDEKGNKIKDKNSKDKMTVKIPLTEQMINIKLDYKDINNSENANVYREVNISNKVLFTMSIIFIILAGISIILLSRFLSKTSRKKTAYELKLNKILREYDRVIITSRKSVKETGTIVDVKSFEELLDARDNLEKPIIFNEIHKGQKCVFIINSDNESYRYVLKQADLEKGE